MTDDYAQQQLTGGGDTLLHYHLQDRTPTHDTVLQLQAVDHRTEVSGSTYTVTQLDDILLCDTTSNNVTLTLPKAKFGREFEVIKMAIPYTVTVLPTSPDTILGATGLTISSQYDAIRLKAVTEGWAAI